jgi:pantothenate kinase
MSPPVVGFAGLVDRLAQPHGAGRRLVAVAGPPGSGKSTVAEALVAALNAAAPGRAAVLPMDGYHFDDAVLTARGRLARKGAPDTFDVGGLAHMLARLRANDEAEIAIPVFDRSIEIARAGAALIAQSVGIVVCEGNYLLADAPPWDRLRDAFDLRVLVSVEEDELRRRLRARWERYGLDEAGIRHKLDVNDLPNGRFVMERSVGVDLVLDGTAALGVEADPG